MKSNSPLANLKPPKGAVKKKRRVGRGPGSGRGKTSGRGHKGQNSRSGSQPHPRFEGGQMPLYRRLPKRGFTNIFRKEFVIINVGELEKFAKNGVVDVSILQEKGRIGKNIKAGLKVLGDGEISQALVVKAHKFSQSAKEKIEKAGGKVEVLEK